MTLAASLTLSGVHLSWTGQAFLERGPTSSGPWTRISGLTNGFDDSFEILSWYRIVSVDGEVSDSVKVDLPPIILTNFEDRVERDRREIEAALFIVLYAVLNKARRHALDAIRIGADPFTAVADVLMGAPQLGLPGLAAKVEPFILQAESAGFRRTKLVAPGPTEQQTSDQQGVAQQHAAQMLGTLHRRIAVAGLPAPDARAALNEALIAGGYAKSGPEGAWLIQLSTEAMVTTAYGDGLWRGWQRPEVVRRLYGFEHVSILDHRTSKICINHSGVKLPATDPFWLTSHPPLHWHCRSVLRPIFKPFVPTAYPTVPPEPGWGRAPGTFVQFIRTNAA